MRPGGDELTSNDERFSLERDVLRGVYQSVFAGHGAWREADIRRLAKYRFHDLTHQVIFDALCEVRSVFAADSLVAPEAIQEQLLQRLTRRGFPDVELESILPIGLQPGNDLAEKLLRMILRLTATDEGVSHRDER